MGLLKKSLAEKNKKLSVRTPGSVTHVMAVPTGIGIIDAETATIGITEDDQEFYIPGLPMGKLVMFVGNSQGGKTTLAIQIADNIAKGMNGDVVLLDYERSSNNPEARIRQITGCTREEYEDRYTIYNQLGMSTEFLKEIIFDIGEMKKKLGKSCFIDHYDLKGNPIKIYPPTIIILDSIPSMKPLEILSNADLDGNMVAGKMAAANKAMLTSITEKLEEFNINIFAINHITTKITINPYAPKKIQLPGLADDENLPGGNSWPYLSSFVFKLTSGAELKADKDLKIEGRKTECRLLKTRSGFNNKRLPLVLHSKVGFSSALSNFFIAKDAKILSGGGRGGFTFEGIDYGFTQGEFWPLYNNPEDSSFREAFDAVMEAHFEAIMATKNAEGAVNTSGGNDDEFASEFDDD